MFKNKNNNISTCNTTNAPIVAYAPNKDLLLDITWTYLAHSRKNNNNSSYFTTNAQLVVYHTPNNKIVVVLPQMHNYLCTTFQTTTKHNFLKCLSCEITHKTCLPQTPSTQNHKQPTSHYLVQIVYK